MENTMERHPFLEGLSSHRGAPPSVIVIFGASGDLTARKLMPALYNLGVDSLLPVDFSFIGYGRRDLTDEVFRQSMKEAVEKFSRRPLDEKLWENLSQKIRFQVGGYDDVDSFVRLRETIEEIERGANCDQQALFYVSTPPSAFASILHNLGTAGLAQRHAGTRLASKVVIEKPFGTDLKSAQELNGVISRHFGEDQVFRIDHYLGKETVQSLLVQRFANTIFEPIWNRRYVECVQITVSESIGVGSRAGYYDKSGALRDMIQNHVMQLLALTAMEPPVSLDPESIRDEKVKVIKAIQPLCLDGDDLDVVRGRYAEGLVDGVKAIDYMEEEGVPDDSRAETFVALRLSINNWRWKGVPFYLRSGKRMARRASEIAIQFKRPPGILFSEKEKFDVSSNVMVLRIQPDEGLALVLNSKVPGLETRTQPVKMNFGYATTFGSNTPEAYERLILDALVGDGTLFIRGDETEASWKLFTPMLDHWTKDIRDPETYLAGSWGPVAADALLHQAGHEWRIAGSG